MKKLYLGILLVTCSICASSSRVRRYSDDDQRSNSEWSWGRNEQASDVQTKVTQVNWPMKGNAGSSKGRGETNPNRGIGSVNDGSWAPDAWSSGDNPNDGFGMGWNAEPQGNNKGSAYPDDNKEQGGDLETLLRGVPGMDFPNFVTIPDTKFDCSAMPSQGYYGDVEAGCQVFHICQPGNRKDSFLCPVGTIFNQKYFVCDWWFNVNCSDTPSYYDLNNEVYKEQAPVTEEVPVTTEKMLPWSSQDLDRKKPTPTKSWGNQPSTGKQNPRWKDTPSKRGSKSTGSVSTSQEVSNSWSRSDVQKEVTVSWGSSSGTASGTYGSSSTSSNAFIPTSKPVWYGIDGQPAKDQSDGMSKRVGMVQTPAPFGTRMKNRNAIDKSNTWGTTEVYKPTTTPFKSSSYKTTTKNIWIKGDDTFNPTSTTKGWFTIDHGTGTTKKDIGDVWSNDVNHPTTQGWIKGEDIPEISIIPTGIKGVWEQQTTKRSDEGDHPVVNSAGHKGFVTKSDQPRNFQTVTDQRKSWGQRQTSRNTQRSTNKGWVKNSFADRGAYENSNVNTIPRQKSWT